MESFYAQVRLGLLDRELFFNLREVKAATSNYAYEYNLKRPHGSLDQRPPTLAAQRELALWPAAYVLVCAGIAPTSNLITNLPADSQHKVSSRRGRIRFCCAHACRVCP